MATTAAVPAYAGTHDHSNSGIWSWITTTDHKRIGVLYLFTAMFFFLLGGLEAILIRAQLHGPNGQLAGATSQSTLSASRTAATSAFAAKTSAVASSARQERGCSRPVRSAARLKGTMTHQVMSAIPM